MEWIQWAIDQFLHFDQHLQQMLNSFGLWTYVFLFLIVFCETGLVVTPFLPGDSLLFAAGALTATHSLNLGVLLVSLAIAAILGDAVNYLLGAKFGERFLAAQRFRGFAKGISIRRTPSLNATATRRLCWLASSQSCGHSHRSWPGSGK